MKVLYLTNIEVPYRIRFFNQLAKYVDLTVVYERRKSANRDATWSKSEEKKYDVHFLDGVNVGNENSFSFSILSWVRKDWDAIIVGCCNSKAQMMAMLYMRMMGIPYYLNLDGEPFIGNGLKAIVKKMMLKGADGYLTAGVKSGESLKAAIGDKRPVVPYFFSSLNDVEIAVNARSKEKRGDYVLVVGQYFDYKGMDVAFRVACMDSSIRYKLVGMGKRTELFLQEMGNMPENVEVTPFLQKAELEEEYRRCSLLLLPTRQECWGLVANEAASFGTPIVSTWGSGAAMEFFGDDYPQFLAKPGDADSLLECVRRCLKADNSEYSAYLKEVSKKYSIERNVDAHLKAFEQIS